MEGGWDVSDQKEWRATRCPEKGGMGQDLCHIPLAPSCQSNVTAFLLSLSLVGTQVFGSEIF